MIFNYSFYFFKKVAGLKPVVHNCNKIVDFFNFVFNDDIVEKIISFTNKSFEKNTRLDQYLSFPLDFIEFRGFIGIFLLLGVLKKNGVEINEIWSPDSLHFCKYASAAMSRSRFQAIICSLVFDDENLRGERFLTISFKILYRKTFIYTPCGKMWVF